MKRKNLLYLSFILTIVIIRVGVFLIPGVDITVGKFILHHFWFGVLLLMINFFIKEGRFNQKFILFGIGLGLFLDELIFMLLGGGGDLQYWNIYSVIGTMLIVLLIFFLRGEILGFYTKTF